MQEASAVAKTAADGIQNQIDFSTQSYHHTHIHRQRRFAHGEHSGMQRNPFLLFFCLPTIVIDDSFSSNSSLTLLALFLTQA